MYFLIEWIQSILLLISAFLVIVAAVGLVSLNKDMKNIVYARIHIVGVFDIACIIAMLALGQYLLAIIYLIIAPFTAHAIANAYYKDEDNENNLELNVVEEVSPDNPFVHPKAKIQKIENQEDISEKNKTDERFSISTIEITEEE